MWEDARVGTHRNFSSGRHLGYLRPVSWDFPSFASLVLTMGSGCSLMAARRQVFFSFLSFLRAHWFTLESCNRWQLWDLLFTNMAGNITCLSHIIRNLHAFEFRNTLAIRWSRKWQPTPVILPGNSHGQRNLVGYVHGVAKSQTWLNDLTYLLYLLTYLALELALCVTVMGAVCDFLRNNQNWLLERWIKIQKFF